MERKGEGEKRRQIPGDIGFARLRKNVLQVHSTAVDAGLDGFWEGGGFGRRTTDSRKTRIRSEKHKENERKARGRKDIDTAGRMKTRERKKERGHKILPVKEGRRSTRPCGELKK